MTDSGPAPEMDEQPQMWHYGLVGRWWAEFNTAAPEELAYDRAAIERFGEPALDLACGAGRLLLPLMSAGLDVDGADLSPDMIAEVRRGALAQGLYFAQELLFMLEAAGFRDVRVEDLYRGRPATPDDSMVVFVAQRPLEARAS